VMREIAQCDIMAVSLGARVLGLVCPLIARGIVARRASGVPPLDILICENLKDAAAFMRGKLLEALPEDDAHTLSGHVGLVETSIGRMVPVMNDVMRRGDPLRLCAEAYNFLPVDAAAFVGGIPKDIPGLTPYTPFGFYEERKLYVHNMGHAMCAYLGGAYQEIWQAACDPAIRALVHGAMMESALALSEKYGVAFRSLHEHVEDLLLRFENQALHDTVERVGRDPLRKLASNDRLVGAARNCAAQGITPAYICVGIAVALAALGGDVEATAREVCALEGALLEQTLRFTAVFQDGAAGKGRLARLLHMAQLAKRRARGLCP